MPKTIVPQVEEYVNKVMKDVASHHDYKHVSRVRNWARQIAAGEDFKETELVEITALLHDIGLAYAEDREFHGEKGAEVAGKYLRENNLLPEAQIVRITEAVKYHSGGNTDGDRLLDILQDADCLEAFGAVGVMRAFISKSDWDDYNPARIKGVMWGQCGRKYRNVFFPQPEEKTIIDR